MDEHCASRPGWSKSQWPQILVLQFCDLKQGLLSLRASSAVSADSSQQPQCSTGKNSRRVAGPTLGHCFSRARALKIRVWRPLPTLKPVRSKEAPAPLESGEAPGLPDIPSHPPKTPGPLGLRGAGPMCLLAPAFPPPIPG